jgi:hypothetical protein
VPVHEGELALRMSAGEEAFEEHLSRHDVAIWDLGRASTA